MDDLKLFAKSIDQTDSLVQKVYVFSEDIGMEFGKLKIEVWCTGSQERERGEEEWYNPFRWTRRETNRRGWIQIFGDSRIRQFKRRGDEDSVSEGI